MANALVTPRSSPHQVFFKSPCQARPTRCLTTCAAPTSQKRRKGRMPQPEDPMNGQPLMLADAEEEFASYQGNSEAAAPLEEDLEGDSREFAAAMAKIAHETKGEDILVLHVAPLVYWTSYMVFITVFSRPQLGAVLGKIEKEADEKWDRTISQGGQPNRTEWEILDLDDVVIHAFTEREREYYDLESFYGAAEQVELPFLQSASSSAGSLSEQTADSLSDDPAWAKAI